MKAQMENVLWEKTRETGYLGPRGASEDSVSLEIICNIVTLYILFRKWSLVFLGILRPDHKKGKEPGI